MGWVKGLEPSTPGTTIRCSNQLSYTHHMNLLLTKGAMARLKPLRGLTCRWHVKQLRVPSAETEPLAKVDALRLLQTRVMARLKGLEPLTHCLEGSCSIHLSYRRVWSG